MSVLDSPPDSRRRSTFACGPVYRMSVALVLAWHRTGIRGRPWIN